MTVFKSKWADWEPKTPTPRTDKTAKRASVSFVSSSPTRIRGQKFNSDREENTPDALTPRTDKTDRRGDGDLDAFEERAGILQFDGEFTREEAERRAAAELGADEKPNSRPPAWDTETARLVDWFLGTEPPSEPFALYPHVHVARPEGYWHGMRANLRLGPGGPRARWGALQKDLRRLAELFGGPQ